MFVAAMRHSDVASMAIELAEKAKRKQERSRTVPSAPRAGDGDVASGSGPTPDFPLQTTEVASGGEGPSEEPAVTSSRAKIPDGETRTPARHRTSHSQPVPTASRGSGRENGHHSVNSVAARSTTTRGSPEKTQKRPKSTPKTPGVSRRRTPGKSRRAKLLKETDKSEPTCDFCQTGLSEKSRHSCQDCPFDLCSICKANIKVLYPTHTSDHRSTEMRQSTTIRDSESCITVHTRSNSKRPAEAVNRSGIRFSCHMCGQVLYDVRYECQQCPDTNLCELDRTLHVVKHTLRPIPCQPTSEVDASSEGHGTAYTGKASSAELPAEARRGSQQYTHRSLLSDTEEDSDHNTDRGTSDGGGKRARRDISDLGDTDDDEYQGVEEDNACGQSDRTSPPAPRRRSRRPQTERQQEETRQITFSVPAKDYHIYAAWVEGILARGLPGTSPSPRRRRPAAGGMRRWRDEDQEQLRELKEQGHTDEEAAKVLGRSVGAVTQQWRKQKGGVT